MRIPAAGDDQKFVIFGGVEYESGKVVFRQEERKNSEGFTKWLDGLCRSIPQGEVLVVVDNARYHRSRVCQQWWEKHKARIKPFFLPAYSPELNMMERIWLYLKSKLNCHRWWADLSALKMATSQLLSNLIVNFKNRDGPKLRLNQKLCVPA